MFRLLLGFALVATACSVDNSAPPASDLDLEAFRCNVEPVLMARCGFYACHGSEARPFRVYAPNRLRRVVSVPQLAAPLTDEERAANVASAIAFVGDQPARETLLLGKPLDADAGGQFHRGKSIYLGRDVFTDESDLGYQRIAAWIEGEQASAGCVPQTEVGP